MIKKAIFISCITLSLLSVAFSSAAESGCVYGKYMYTTETTEPVSNNTACPGVPVYEMRQPGMKDISSSCFDPNALQSICYLRISATTGTCGTFRSEIDCPIDNFVWVLLVLTATTTIFFFRKHRFIEHVI